MKYVTVVAFLSSICLTASAGAQSDIFGGVTQSAVDKVVRDAQYPVTLIRQDTLRSKSAERLRTILLTPEQVKALLAEAEAKGCPNKDAQLACAMKAQNQKLDTLIERAKAQRQKAGSKWKGEDDAALEAKARSCFETKIVVSHLQVNLLDPPGLTISGSSISATNVHLDTDVTVQLWSKIPQWVCDQPCPIIGCCWGHFTCDDWKLLVTVPVRDVKTTTSATVTLRESGAKVLGTPQLTKLTVVIPVFGEVDLTGLANLFLKLKEVTVYDAGKLIATIPVLKTTYQVKAIKLSGTTELRIDVTIEKIVRHAVTKKQ